MRGKTRVEEVCRTPPKTISQALSIVIESKTIQKALQHTYVFMMLI